MPHSFFNPLKPQVKLCEVLQLTLLIVSHCISTMTVMTLEGDWFLSYRIQQKRHGRVKTWTRHVDIFEKDFIFVPLNEA